MACTEAEGFEPKYPRKVIYEDKPAGGVVWESSPFKIPRVDQRGGPLRKRKSAIKNLPPSGSVPQYQLGSYGTSDSSKHQAKKELLPGGSCPEQPLMTSGVYPEMSIRKALHVEQKKIHSYSKEREDFLKEVKMAFDVLVLQKSEANIKVIEGLEEISRLKSSLDKTKKDFDAERSHWVRVRAALQGCHREEMAVLSAHLSQAREDLKDIKAQIEAQKLQKLQLQACKEEVAAVNVQLAEATKKLDNLQYLWTREKSSLMEKHNLETFGLVSILTKAHNVLETVNQQWEEEKSALLAMQEEETIALISGFNQFHDDLNNGNIE